MVSLLLASGYAFTTVITFAAVFAVLIGIVAFYTVYFAKRYLAFKYKTGEKSGEIWAPTDIFDIERDTVTIEKDPKKDFIIAIFPDIQVWQPFRLGKKYVIYNTIKNVVDKTKPDMIVLLGDNAFFYSRQCYQKIVDLMEEIGVPWAPVFGNHDYEGNADLQALGDILLTGKHCLYRKGPRNLHGEGNYAVNIRENGKIVHTLFFFDTGESSYEYDEEKRRYLKAKDVKDTMPAYYRNRIHEGKHKGEVLVGDEWGAISYDQIQYYKWLLAGIAEANGEKPESSFFCHVAPYEFNDAYFEWVEGGCDPEKGFGELNVAICSAQVPTGLFDAILEEGSTKNVIFGHEHENDLSLLYRGVRMSYAVKCGDECTTFADTINGGSVLTVDSQGKGSYKNVRVPLEGKRHYDKMMWYYDALDKEREKEWAKKEAEEEGNE